MNTLHPSATLSSSSTPPAPAPLDAQEQARTAVLDASLADLAEWEQRPGTQIVSERLAASSPYLVGSGQRPRNVRTLRRWRTAQPRRGPAYVKIGGRYYYTVAALRDFYQRSVRGELT